MSTITIKQVNEEVASIQEETNPTLRAMRAAQLFRRVLEAVDQGAQDARLMARSAVDLEFFVVQEFRSPIVFGTPELEAAVKEAEDQAAIPVKDLFPDKDLPTFKDAPTK